MKFITGHRYYGHPHHWSADFIHEFKVVEQTKQSIKIRHLHSGAYSIYDRKEFLDDYSSFEDLGKSRVKR